MENRLVQELGTYFRNHNDEAVRLATRLVGTTDRGEEVVMSVWLRLAALLSRKSNAPPSSLRDHPCGYLFRAVRNMATDHLIRLRRETEHRVEMESIDSVAGEDATAEDLLYLRRKIAVLRP